MAAPIERQQRHQQERRHPWLAGGRHRAELLPHHRISRPPEPERQRLPTLRRHRQQHRMPAVMQRVQQRADIDLRPHGPEPGHRRPRRRRTRRAAHAWSAAHRPPDRIQRAAACAWTPRHPFRLGDLFGVSAEPPWPLAFHPPRACVCRWAPDTETRISAEPAPGRMLSGPGDELPDAPGSSAEPT